MSAVQTVQPSTTLPPDTQARIPLGRLVRVELRKLVDTRSGRWLAVAIGVITVAAVVVLGLAAPERDRTFLSFVGVTATPQGFLLPVMGILLVTSEWTQRTALVTFTLEPRRGRVIAAKVVAALLAGLAAIVVALAVAAVATLLLGGSDPWRGVDGALLGRFALLQVSGVLQGLAFGLLFLNSAAAIVTYFVLPTAFSVVASLWKTMDRVQPWLDLGYAQQPLFGSDPMTAAQWQHLATTSALWIVAPFVLGLVRVMRAEVK